MNGEEDDSGFARREVMSTSWPIDWRTLAMENPSFPVPPMMRIVMLEGFSELVDSGGCHL